MLLDAPLEAVVLEPHVGGRILARGTGGSECAWSRILVWDPPRRLSFGWHITVQWEIETDPNRCSEVDVTFTLVTDTGWAHDLTLFAAAAQG